MIYHHSTTSEKIYVTETHASAARSASVCGAGCYYKTQGIFSRVTHTRVKILVSLPYDSTAKFRCGFVAEWQLRDATRRFRFKARTYQDIIYLPPIDCLEVVPSPTSNAP